MGRKQKLRLEKKAKIVKKNNEVAVAAAAAAAATSLTLATGIEATTTTTTTTAYDKFMKYPGVVLNCYDSYSNLLVTSPSAIGTDTGSKSAKAAAATASSDRDTYTGDVGDEESELTSVTGTGTGLISVVGTTSTMDRYDDKYEDEDSVFPQSEFYDQAMQSIKEMGPGKETTGKFMLGAIEHGCVHSMCMLGSFILELPSNEWNIHYAYSWFLDGLIRGSFNCGVCIATDIFPRANAKSGSTAALLMYWTNFLNKCTELSGDLRFSDKIITKELTQNINRKCVICSRTDTATLTLRQCMGCSTYCYCGKDCQTYHWEEGNHKNECRQLKILNKYHKPYVKEIRDAAIRGENHPALEKLRVKLGLNRPIDEHEDKWRRATNPCEILIARDDGTVWVGTTPDDLNSVGSSSDTTITTTTASAKDDRSY